MTLHEHIAELEPQPLASASALPARWYVDPAIPDLDRDAVFVRAWHLIAHVCQLPATGDHVIADLAGVPVIAVRGDDGAIRVLHNVCRHRAGPLARCDGRGAKALRCLYHGWTYDLDGRLRAATEMRTAADFDPAGIRLPQCAVRLWQGLVFAALDADTAPDFEAFVAGIDARLGRERGLAGYGHHHRASYALDCHWKVYVDNYLEGYHIPHVHPTLNRMLDYRSYATEVAPWHALQWSPLDSEDALYGSGDALYYWLWPHTMLNVLPGRLQTNRVVATGADRCRVDFDYYYAPEQDEGDGATRARREADLGFSDAVQREDVLICEDVQRGLASGSYFAGRLNPLRENGVHRFHELLRDAYRLQLEKP